jgi:imidazolonepropionase-like amidohydrolase
VRRQVICLLTLAVTAAFVLPASTPVSGQAQRAVPRVVALRGGTVVTVTKGTIANGTVVMRDGKIAAVGGPGTDIPTGADVINVTGKFISPGIIDAHSHMANDSINEGGTTVSSMTGIEDVLDPTDVSLYRAVAGGLTSANILHGSANPIGGKNSVIKIRWGAKKASDLIFQGAMPGIKFALGENPKSIVLGQQTGPQRYPASRAGVEYVIRDAFTRAKAYQKEWQAYEKAKGSSPDMLAPRRDLQLEPLVEILEGKRLVHAHSYRSDEILMMLRVAEEFGFKIATLQHVLEGYKVAKEIAAHGAGASTFSDWWGYKIEANDAIPYNAAIMHRKGVVVSINSDSAEHTRRLNTEAAKSMRWGGLTEDEALSLVTINPAKQLRIDSRVGSIETGKDADVVVWTHHPLSAYAIVDRTYIDGTLYYNRATEEQRLAEVRKEKEALMAAERAQRRPTTNSNQDAPSWLERLEERRAAEREGYEHQGHDGEAFTAQGRTTSTSASGGTTPMGVQKPAPAVWAITNARIVTVAGPVIERGSIVIRNGKIEAVGANVQVPAGAPAVDAAGGHVYPGFINARTTVGIGEPGVRGYDDIGEMLDYNQHMRTRMAYHAASDAIPVARANGITSVAVAPTGGIFGGEVPVMNLDGWTFEEATVKPNVGITFNFPALGGGGGGRGGGGGGGRGGGAPGGDRTFDDVRRERDRRLAEIDRVLDQARAYVKEGATRTMNWELEAFVPVVEGRLPLLVNASREQDIKDAVAWAEKARVKIVISGGTEANLVAPLLKEKNIPVILGNILSGPARPDWFHASTYQLAGELAKAGVKFAFSSGDNTNVRLLPNQAAMSVAWGLDRDAAIRALTVDAAQILGVADRIGTIEAGKDANLFFANGDPLEIKTQVTRVVIKGRDVGLQNKHLALYEMYMARQ